MAKVNSYVILLNNYNMLNFLLVVKGQEKIKGK